MKRRLWCPCCIAAGIVLFLVGVVFFFLVPVIAPGLQQQYGNRALFRDWTGWTRIYMLIHPFLYAPIFAAVFLRLRQDTCMPDGVIPTGIKGGLIYGAGVFCVGSLPVFLLAFASFQVSREIMLSWIVQNLCQYLAAGAALGVVADGRRTGL